jgi:threonine dehydratase
MNTVYDEFLSPSVREIKACAQAIDPYIIRTPTHQWSGCMVERYLGADSELHLKLELFQRTGTFKARAAIHNVLQLSDEERSRGVTTVSAGNHAVATAYAAMCFGIRAKVVMLASANPARINAARHYGAEILIAEDGVAGFQMVEEINATEGLHIIPAFEGRNVTCATATCGMEVVKSLQQLDAIVVPIGGGGLCSGIAVAVKKLNPDCKVFGVEPVGAAVMTESLNRGAACELPNQVSIADSLMPPMTMPYAYTMCHQFVDEIALVEDMQIAAAAVLLFSEMKLAVEAAAAVTTAAAFGPLREQLQGRRTALIVCGSNTDLPAFSRLMEMGNEALGKGVLA